MNQMNEMKNFINQMKNQYDIQIRQMKKQHDIQISQMKLDLKKMEVIIK